MEHSVDTFCLNVVANNERRWYQRFKHSWPTRKVSSPTNQIANSEVNSPKYRLQKYDYLHICLDAEAERPSAVQTEYVGCCFPQEMNRVLSNTPFTRYNRLSNGLSNRFDNRLDMFVYTIQPVVQPVVLCIETSLNRLTGRFRLQHLPSVSLCRHQPDPQTLLVLLNLDLKPICLRQHTLPRTVQRYHSASDSHATIGRYRNLY